MFLSFTLNKYVIFTININGEIKSDSYYKINKLKVNLISLVSIYVNNKNKKNNIIKLKFIYRQLIIIYANSNVIIHILSVLK